MKKTLFLRVFSGYAAVIVLLALAVMFVAPPLMRTHHIQEQAAGLDHLAMLLEGPVLPFLTGGGSGDLGELVSSFGKKTGRRITVIDASGKVLADSEQNAGDMESHLFRPEIQAALQGEKRLSIRESSTLKTEMMYLSSPLKVGGTVVGVLRLSLFMKDFEALMADLRGDLLKAVALVTVLALVMAFFFTRSVSRPLREFIDASSRVTVGDLEVRVSERRGGEFGELARSFNAMAGQLRTMLAETRLQNEEINGILASTYEGLCVLDGNSRVVLCNASFRRIVGNDIPEGKYFWEVVRSSTLSEVVRRVREIRSAAAGEVGIDGKPYLYNAAYLASGDRIVVTVLNIMETQDRARS